MRTGCWERTHRRWQCLGVLIAAGSDLGHAEWTYRTPRAAKRMHRTLGVPHLPVADTPPLRQLDSSNIPGGVGAVGIVRFEWNCNGTSAN